MKTKLEMLDVNTFQKANGPYSEECYSVKII